MLRFYSKRPIQSSGNFPGGFLPRCGWEELSRFHRRVRQLPGERDHGGRWLKEFLGNKSAGENSWFGQSNLWVCVGVFPQVRDSSLQLNSYLLLRERSLPWLKRLDMPPLSTLSVSARATLTPCNRKKSSFETTRAAWTVQRDVVCLVFFLEDVMFFALRFSGQYCVILAANLLLTTAQQHGSPSLCSNVELPFHWRIMEPNLRLLLPGESPDPSRNQLHLATDDAFQVRPPAGVLAACRDEEFLLTFCPKEVLFRGDEIF